MEVWLGNQIRTFKVEASNCFEPKKTLGGAMRLFITSLSTGSGSTGSGSTGSGSTGSGSTGSGVSDSLYESHEKNLAKDNPGRPGCQV